MLQDLKTFVYLGSMVSQTALLDCKISARIQKAAAAFGKLTDRVWGQHNFTPSTKIMVYSAFVITSLLYTCETSSTYTHIKTLEHFHQKCLRHILKIKWHTFVQDTKVLLLAGVPPLNV